METVEHGERTTAFRWTGGNAVGGSPPADERSSRDGERDRETVLSDDEIAILYVHGSGATHRAWAPQYAPDGPGGSSIAVDLSGHGESSDVDTDPGPATLSAYVDDVAAVASETDADVLVGNSLGGAVVLQAVLDGVVSPTALVLVGSGAKLAVYDPLRELLADDFEAAVEFLHDDDRLFHDADEETIARSKAEMRVVGQRVTRRDFLTCHQFDVRQRLEEVDVPTLAVCGNQDQLTPPEYHEYLAENVRDGRFETVADAAHLVMVERPTAFNEVLASFLESIGEQ